MKCKLVWSLWKALWQFLKKINTPLASDFPGGSGSKVSCWQCGRPWVKKILWRRQRQPTPVLLPGKSHGRKSLVGYSPRGHKESDVTERLHFHFLLLTKRNPKRVFIFMKKGGKHIAFSVDLTNCYRGSVYREAPSLSISALSCHSFQLCLGVLGFYLDLSVFCASISKMCSNVTAASLDAIWLTKGCTVGKSRTDVWVFVVLEVFFKKNTNYGIVKKNWGTHLYYGFSYHFRNFFH